MDVSGTAWRLIGFETDTGFIPAARQTPATLDFSAEGDQAGRLGGSGGCNRYTASYTLTGDRLTIGPMASTRMMCGPEQMAQEDRYFQALQTAERCELRDGELRITCAGGTLRFAQAHAPAGGQSQQGDVPL